MNRRLLPLLLLTAACSASTGGGRKIGLRSNQPNTSFFVDGKPVGKGKSIEVRITNGTHEIGAKADGYVLKTDTINPPYPRNFYKQFFFLIEDQERFAAGAAPPTPPPPAIPPPAPVLETIEPKGPSRIWLFAVGISKYADASIALEYADADAKAIAGFYEKQGIIPDDRRFLLTNEQATRANVLSALTTLSKRSAPNDLLIVYLAMHGLPDDGGDLYFLTYDTDPRRLVGTGLPQRDVEYALGSAKARRVVMMLDACHAGAAGFGFTGKRGIVLAETNRLIGKLADTKPGVAVLTASSATEPSNESNKWGGGHGVFTHYLLLGMHGRADANKDGVVSIRELYDFVYGEVSNDTGGLQHPELKGRFDNEMPIAEIK